VINLVGLRERPGEQARWKDARIRGVVPMSTMHSNRVYTEVSASKYHEAVNVWLEVCRMWNQRDTKVRVDDGEVRKKRVSYLNELLFSNAKHI